MKYYVSQKNNNKGDGSEQNPFKTINQAAEIAVAGDEVIVSDGIYRECVSPKNGGTGNNNRIIYKNEKGAKPVITGAEVIKQWNEIDNSIWKATVSNEIFHGYNPFDDLLYGDWYYNLEHCHHTAEVYLEGVSMFEVDSYEELKGEGRQVVEDIVGYRTFDHPDVKTLRRFRWFSQVTEHETFIYVNFNTINPNNSIVEINVRKHCFFPENEGKNYITVSGFIIKQGATQWAPPTAFQDGLIGPHWSKGWIIENCTISESKCAGISLGKKREFDDNIWSKNPIKGGAQRYTEVICRNIENGWNKQNIGSHIIRNNVIFNCGQNGIVGNMGGAFSVICKNHIHNINSKFEFNGAEIAAIKLHSAIDIVIENNCVHDSYRGLWLDWQAQGAQVYANSFFANLEDLFIEVCHGPCIVANNLLLSANNFLNVSQGTAIVHNLFNGKVTVKNDTDRFTLYHRPHSTNLGGVMFIYGGDDKIINNIYLGGRECGNHCYNGYNDVHDMNFSSKENPVENIDITLPVNIHDNMYFNESNKYDKEVNAIEIEDFHPILKVVKEENNYYLYTNLYESNINFKRILITTEEIGVAFQSDMAYENKDGSRIIIDKDFIGITRNSKDIYCGPFNSIVKKIKLNFNEEIIL